MILYSLRIEGWSTHEHISGTEARGILDGLGVVLARPRVLACERCESISALTNEQVLLISDSELYLPIKPHPG